MKNQSDLFWKLGTLSGVVLLMLSGSYRLSQDGRDGTALWAAAMILLGVVITVELHDRFGRDHHDDDCDDEDRGSGE